MQITTKPEIVDFLRKKNVKVSIRDLADYFKLDYSTMRKMLKKIYEDRNHYLEYKGFDREYVDMKRDDGTPYKCLVYFVKEN